MKQKTKSKDHLFVSEKLPQRKQIIIKSDAWHKYRAEGFSESECDLLTCKYKLN